MSNSFYESQVDDLYLLDAKLKDSLGELKFVKADCPETSLMLNETEEELTDIEQRMATFDNFLLNDITKQLKVCENNEQSIIIKEIFDKISHDLSVLASKITYLKKKYTVDYDDVEDKIKEETSYSFYESQLEDLYFLHDMYKTSLEPLKFLSVNCPETSLMLNEIEEELTDMEQRMDTFNSFLLKADEDIEQSIIVNKGFDKIRLDLSVLSTRIAYLKKKYNVNTDC